MAEIAYLTGQTDELYFKSAEAYFTYAFKGSTANKVVWKDTLDALLRDLAGRSTTFDVVHIVTHASAQAALILKIAASSASRSLEEADLDLALDNWDQPEGAFCRPLWARTAGGKPPKSVGPDTIIQIDGCEIGQCPSFLAVFGEMFGLTGTVRAPVRVSTFFVGPPPAMSQARTLSFVEPGSTTLPTDPRQATERSAFNDMFVDRYMARILATPEATLWQKELQASFKPALAVRVASAQTVRFLEITPFVHVGPMRSVFEVSETLTQEQAAERVVLPDPKLEAIPYFGTEPDIAEDAMFPIQASTVKFAVTVTPMKIDVSTTDPETGTTTTKKVDGTQVVTTATWVELFIPLVDAAGTGPAVIDPTDPSYYTTVSYTSRAVAPATP